MPPNPRQPKSPPRRRVRALQEWTPAPRRLYPWLSTGKAKAGPMQSVITGKAYVLGDNVDTDQIIPAQYLSFNPRIPEERKFFGMYAMSSVPRAGGACPPATCGSSGRTSSRATTRSSSAARTSAAAAAGSTRRWRWRRRACKCVIAEFYARIFFRNSVNGGYLVPLESQAAPGREGPHRRRVGGRTSTRGSS